MSICKRGNKWSFRVYVDDPISLKRRQIEKKGFDTKREAKFAEAEFVNNFENNMIPSGKVNFQTAYNFFLNEKRKEWRETTYFGNKIILDARILLYFKEYNMTKINKQIINLWRKKLDDEGLCYRYKNKLLTNLKGIFKYANVEFNINNHIMENEPPFKNDNNTSQLKGIYSENEFKQYYSKIDDVEIKTFFVILFYSGMRIGEIRALNWKDIDTSQGVIHVNKSLTNKTFSDKYEYVQTKTNSSNRDIYYPKNIINELLFALKNEKYPVDSSIENLFIFGGHRPFAETTIRRYNLFYANLAGLKAIRIHDFRHSYVTMLYHKGIDMVSTKDQVGHSSIRTTVDVYLKLDSEKRKTNIEQAFL